MKKTNSIFLLVFCLILIMLTGSVSAQQCICLDEYGYVYPNETLSTTICYQYNSDNILLPTMITFKQCQDINTAYAQKVEQERIKQQQALEEQQRQQALEEQQRQQALEEQQRQQALEEQQRQQALEEQQRQQALEEQQNNLVSNTPVTLQNETNEQQSGPQFTEQNSQNPEPVQVQMFSLSQSNVNTLNSDSNGMNNNVTPGNNEGNDANNNIVPLNNEENDTNNNIVPLSNEGNDTNNDITPLNNEENDTNNDVTPGNNQTDVTNNNGTPETDQENDTNENVPPVNNEGNENNVVLSPITNEEGKGSDDILTPDQTEKQSGETKTDAENEQKQLIPETALTLSDKTAAELSALLTEEELANLSTILTPEWLNANSENLSDAALAELTALLHPLEPVRTVSQLKAPAPAVEIEGKLLTIMLSEPNGSIEDASAVPFVWLYDYDTTSGSSDVTFTLELSITAGSDSKSYSSTISAASCQNRICTYTADLSSLLGESKTAAVSWTVSGSYKDGETTIEISAPPAQSFTIKAPTPTPVPPTPTPKPDVPVQEAPNGTHTSRSVGFYWKPSKNAESYTVEWKHENGKKGSMNLSAQDETCEKGKCILYANLPDTGRYSWTVTAKNASGSATSPEMKFKIINNLPTPNPYRPNGTIFNHTYPAFEWEDVRNGAYEYRIQVVGKYDNRLRMDHWFNVNDIYVGKGVCYLQSSLFLPAGSYSWRVMARNGDTTSGWSSWRDFYVECDYCNYNNVYYQNYANTVPTCSYPVGTITVNTPDFQWRTLTGASYYTVTLYDAAGSVLFNEQVSNSACTAELCSWSPKYRLTKNGNYSWYVSGYGANGSRWGSANTTFTLNGAVVMKDMSFLRPEQNGLLTDEAPVIIWTDPGESTALFHMEIFNNANTQLFSADLNRQQAWCDGQTCSIEFKTIPNADNYRITITPYSELNTVGKAISLTFSKGGIKLKLNSPKEGSTVSSRPLFRWGLDAGTAAQYDLVLTDELNNVTTFSPLTCGAVGVTCEGNEAFFSPSDPLPAGTYTAKIVGPGSAYLGEEVHFTIR